MPRFRRLVVAVAAVTSVALTPIAAHAETPGFTVSGNKILDPTGATFTMRGTNILCDTTLNCIGRTTADIDPMVKMWHLNTLRLLVSEDFWIGSQPTIDGHANDNYCPAFVGYQSTIDNWVRTATDAGMLVLIDLHTNEMHGSIPCTTTVKPPRLTMADEALAPTYWRQMASKYAGNDHVAFEPYNEPQCLTAQEWLHGGDVTRNSCAGTDEHFPAAGMQELYDVIRAAGADNLVVIDGVKDKSQTPAPSLVDSQINPAGGYDVSYALSTPVVGVNVAYASHPYLGSDCGNLPPTIEEKVGIPSLSVPVVIDEFGSSCTLTPDDNGAPAAAKYAEVVSWAESHQLGWAAFAWGRHHCGLNDKDEWNCSYGLLSEGGSYQPSVAGAPVYADAVAHGTAGVG